MRASLLTLILLFGLFLVLPAQSAVLRQEGFEGVDFTGYSTAENVFTANGSDYFTRGTNGAPFQFAQPVTGFEGSNFLGWEDLDGALLNVDPHWIELDPIDITGYTNLSVNFLFVAPSISSIRYEIEDYFEVQYSIDGGSYVTVARFIGGVLGSGSWMHEDLDLDGIGDLAVIGPAMQRFSYLLGATGSSLKVRFLFSSTGPQEEMALDDINVEGDFTCSDPTVPAITATPTSICPSANSSLGISGTLNDATEWYVYTGSCGGTQVGSTATNSFGVSPSSTTTYYVRGEGGCVTPGSCGTVTVTASDTTNPVITCPANQSLIAGGGGQAILPDYTSLATVNDNCDASPSVTQLPIAGATISSTTTVTLTSSDSSSNTSPCSFSVNLVSPEIELSQGATPIADGGSQGFGNQLLGSDTDLVFTVTNSGSSSLNLTTPITLAGVDSNQFSIQEQPASTVASSGGTTTFTVRFTPTSLGSKTATIALGNDDTDENPYNITLTGTGTAPEIAITQGATPIADGGSQGFGSQIVGSDTDLVFTITNSGTSNLNLTAPITLGGADSNQFSIEVQPASTVASGGGTTTFTVRFTPTTIGAKTASIALGNNDSDENPYNLTFTGTGVDNEDPTITCPGNQTLNADHLGQATLIDYTSLPTVTDNVDPSPVVTQSPIAGGTINDTTTITLTATDSSNNSNNCTFDVSLVDVTDPTITCPGNQILNANDNGEAALYDYRDLATVADNMDPSPAITQSPASGTSIGDTTMVTLTATDASTNSSNCGFEVALVDVTPPVFNNVPSDITVKTQGASITTRVVHWIEPTATDNIDGSITPIQTEGPANGSDFPVGTTTITYSATDSENNTSTASFTVTVVQGNFSWLIFTPGLVSPNAVSGETD